MKWILLFLLFCFSAISFNSYASVVDKQTYARDCQEPRGNGNYRHGYSMGNCAEYVSQTLDFDDCGYTPGFTKNNTWVCDINPNGIPHYKVLLLAYPYNGDLKDCPITHPYETDDGRCTDLDNSIKCTDSETQKQIQNEQYICQISNPNSSFYEAAFNWSCSDNETTNTPDISTSCNYDTKNCIQGLTCESESQPETPICNPENEDCALPPETPIEEIPEESTNPDDLNANPNPCELGVDLCNNSDTAFTDEPNQNPDSSSVSDNPNLNEGDNALYKEAVTTNQHLENMNHKMKEFVSNYDSKSDQNNKLYKAQLGQQTEINNHLDNIENELNKSFCDKNPNHPDCAKTPFGDLPDFTQSNHFATVFDSSKFAELSQKKDDLTQQIQDKINQFKTDLNITPSFSGGSYTDENITLSGRWGTVSTSNSYWSDNSSLISSAIIALCSLVAFSIVIVRRR